MSDQDVRVEFRYRLHGENHWHSIPLSGFDYYDPEQEGSDARIDLYFVPLHLDERKYVPSTRASIAEIEIKEVDPVDGYWRLTKTQYWSEGHCRLIHTTTTLPDETSNLLVLQTHTKETDTLVTTHLRLETGQPRVVQYLANVNERLVDTFSNKP